MDMILPPYSGLNPWSKYVPMPPRQKKTSSSLFNPSLAFRGGTEQAIPKSLCQAKSHKASSLDQRRSQGVLQTVLTGAKNENLKKD